MLDASMSVDFLHDFVHIYWPSARSVRVGGDPVAGYHVGPFLLLELLPFAYLPLAPAKWLWFAGSIFEVYVGSRIAESLLGRCAPRAVYAVLGLALLSSVMVLDSLLMGQLGVLASLAVLACLWLLREEGGRDYEAGIVLGLGIAVKPTWGVWLLLFLLLRRYRALGAALATLALSWVLPALFLGIDSTIRITQLSFERCLELRATIANAGASQHFAHVVQRWLSHAYGSDARDVAARLAVLRPLSLGLFVLGVGWTLGAALRRKRAMDPLSAAVAVATLMPFAVPTSWPLDFTALPFLQAATLARILDIRAQLSRRRYASCLALVAASLLLSNVLLRYVTAAASDLGGAVLLAQIAIAVACFFCVTSVAARARPA